MGWGQSYKCYLFLNYCHTHWKIAYRRTFIRMTTCVRIRAPKSEGKNIFLLICWCHKEGKTDNKMTWTKPFCASLEISERRSGFAPFSGSCCWGKLTRPMASCTVVNDRHGSRSCGLEWATSTFSIQLWIPRYKFNTGIKLINYHSFSVHTMSFPMGRWIDDGYVVPQSVENKIYYNRSYRGFHLIFQQN